VVTIATVMVMDDIIVLVVVILTKMLTVEMFMVMILQLLFVIMKAIDAVRVAGENAVVVW
jgi:hypothetical protein